LQAEHIKEKALKMTNENNDAVKDFTQEDSTADAIAAVAILTIIVVTVVYWLSTLN
jgi:hypothetical protein